ncbi:hypothetical protein BGW37DRAFT_519984 [Umbelopsis sp. PMI_123]|nr:hypothetical protein BGW37DRAFT_519984 [Umbelopsis sp. PMI_123]
MSEQEKLEKRRQRRQQKIMAAAGDRLSRITGTAYPDRLTPSPVPSPSNSTTSIKSAQNIENQRVRASSPLETSSSTPTSRHSPDPSVLQLPRRGSHLDPDETLGAPTSSAFNSQLAEHFPGEDEANARIYQDRMAAIQRMFGLGGPGSPPFGDIPGAPGMNTASSSQQDPMSSFPFNPAMMAGMQPVQTTPDTTAKYWTLIHFVTMSLLGIYAVISEFKITGSSHFAHLMLNKEPDSVFPYGPSFPLFWYFVTLELILQSSRLFYQKGQPPQSSILGSIAAYLPPPFSTGILLFLRYSLIWKCLVNDCCLLLFIVGMAQLTAAIFG